MVKVFTTPTCTYCLSLKEFLKEHKVSFEEINVSQNEEARDYIIEKSGQMGVPVLEIGQELVIGFDKEKIKKLLKLKE